ncbi:hypothetical protein M5D96_010816, partial [Drosophila gunungcola]
YKRAPPQNQRQSQKKIIANRAVGVQDKCESDKKRPRNRVRYTTGKNSNRGGSIRVIEFRARKKYNLYIMGSTTSKAYDNTANVVNNVEIVDHKEDITKVYNVLCLITGLLIFMLILSFLRIYKRSVQRRRDHGHELEKIMAVAANWPERSQH